MNNLNFDSIFRRLKKLEKQICCLIRNNQNPSEPTMVGGSSMFTADGNILVHDIVHNAGFIPSYFSLTTTQPITNNHLNRTITFPDENTMRITFMFVPNSGEDANYIYILHP